MALTIRSTSNSSPIKLKTFYGLHESPDGDTQLAFGEAPVMRNLRITSRTGEKKNAGGHLQTRPGNETIIGVLKGYELNVSTTEISLIKETLKSTEQGLTLKGYNTATVTNDGFVNLSMSTVTSPFQLNWSFLESTSEQNIYFYYEYKFYKYSRFSHIENEDGTFTFIWHVKEIKSIPDSDDLNYKVQGIWSGTLNGHDTMVCACNGRLWDLWDYETASYRKLDVGEVDCTNRCSFFLFGNKLYIVNGKEYKYYDGISCKMVQGYRPLIAVRDPSGTNSTLIENVNKLTGARKVWFNADGTSTEFILPEGNLVTLDWIHLTSDDSEIDPTTYTVDLSVGKVTFTTAPAQGQKNIEIAYTANNTFRTEVEKMCYCEIFNGSVDTRVFLYGNGTNEAIFSDVDYWQQARADYFPDLNELAVGANDTPIMDMCRHSTYLICNKQNESYYIEQSSTYDALNNLITTFAVIPINKIIGSSVAGQMQMVTNNPRFLFGKELYEWRSQNRYGTLTHDERQAVRISDRIYETLSGFDIANTYCFDFNYGQEYYISNNGTLLINNYANDTWYMYTDIDMYCACEFLGELYFGTKDGKIQKFSDEYLTNDGVSIDAWWESGYMDFGYENMRKATSYIYVVLNPQSRGKMLLTAVTDRRTSYANKEVSSDMFTFDNMNFADFTFNTNDAARSKRIKLKLKKYVFMKLILKSAGLDTRFTALSVDIETRFTGKAK